MEKLKNLCLSYKSKYGLWGIAAILLVVAKYIVFYDSMGIKSNFALVCLISCLITGCLFNSFKNKYIPAALYLLGSILMFADITYYTFFNKYLSVKVLASASFLGEVSGSVLEVIKPANFLMFVDVIVIFVAIFMSKKQKPIEDEALQIEKELEEAVEERWPDEHKDEAEKEKPKFSFKAIYLYRVLPICLVALLILGSGTSNLLLSLTKQEIYTYHVDDILASILPEEEVDMSDVASQDAYQQEKDGPLFGIAEGRNLIVVQMESFQNTLIGLETNGQEITPFLNSLIEDNSIYFDNYFQQIGMGNTSDAEFATNNSIMGTTESYTYMLYQDNYFRGLPWLLKEKGYETAAFHGADNMDFWNRRTIYPVMGFNNFYGGIVGSPTCEGGMFEPNDNMSFLGMNDEYFFQQSVDFMKEFKQPFYSFMVTLSNHHPYEVSEENKKIEVDASIKDTLVGRYFENAAYADYSLEKFFQYLKEAGLYENSIIALYGDHTGLPPGSDEATDKYMSELLGVEYEWDHAMEVPLIIHIPNTEEDITQVNHNYGGQLDFLPTIAYLMGFEELDTIYFGHNILNYTEGVVAIQAYLPVGSFYKEGIGFELSIDTIYDNSRAWDIETREPIEDFYDLCWDAHRTSVDTFIKSLYILRNDVLRKIYQEGMTKEEALANPVVE